MPESKTISQSHAVRFRKNINEVSTTYKNRKRDYTESFGQRDYEVERYGQEIDDQFFATNQGHSVQTPSID